MIFHYIYIIEYLFFSIKIIFLSHFLLSMSQQLMFSEFSSDENLSNNNNNNNKEGLIRRKRKTIKRREGFDNNNNNNSPSKVQKMKEMLQPLDDDDDDGDNLANFNQEFTPPQQPQSAGAERIESRDMENIEEPAKENNTSYPSSDQSVGVEGYNGMTEGYTEQYVNQFVPYYQNAANVSTSNNNSEITEKLNYLIHLIEEQQDEKVGHVTEELILYSFLGVFVIYIVDSFARVGKYVR